MVKQIGSVVHEDKQKNHKSDKGLISWERVGSREEMVSRNNVASGGTTESAV